MPLPIILILSGTIIAAVLMLKDIKEIIKSTKKEIEKTNKMCRDHKFYRK